MKDQVAKRISMRFNFSRLLMKIWKACPRIFSYYKTHFQIIDTFNLTLLCASHCANNLAYIISSLLSQILISQRPVKISSSIPTSQMTLRLREVKSTWLKSGKPRIQTQSVQLKSILFLENTKLIGVAKLPRFLSFSFNSFLFHPLSLCIEMLDKRCLFTILF